MIGVYFPCASQIHGMSTQKRGKISLAQGRHHPIQPQSDQRQTVECQTKKTSLTVLESECQKMQIYLLLTQLSWKILNYKNQKLQTMYNKAIWNNYVSFEIFLQIDHNVILFMKFLWFSSWKDHFSCFQVQKECSLLIISIQELINLSLEQIGISKVCWLKSCAIKLIRNKVGKPILDHGL